MRKLSALTVAGAAACLMATTMPAATAERIKGDDRDNVLIGTGDRDSIRGLAGDDTISARRAIDTGWGGLGADLLRLGRGADTAIAGRGPDVVYGGIGRDTLYGSKAAIHEGDELEDGDTFRAGRGPDRIYLGGGADTLIAGAGNDWALVTADRDRDVIMCGKGRDVISLYHKRDRHDRFVRCERVRVYHGEI